MKLNTYLTFNGNCEEAMNFYKSVFGGEYQSFSRFKDGPDEMGGTKVPDKLKEKIMHLTLKFGENLLMASDSFEEVPFGNNITLSIQPDDLESCERIFNELSAGGKITMPLQDTFWESRFGMFTDQFGVNWMVNCPL